MEVDTYLSKNKCNNYELKYVDISSPEVLDYLEDVNNIVERMLPLPYVSVNGRPFCWGVEDPGEVFEKLKEEIC